MEFSAWDHLAGTRQGRVTPVNWPDITGTYAYVLGDDFDTQTAALNIGDYVEVSQTAEFYLSTHLVHVTTRVRSPAVVPTGVKWVFSLRIDGVDLAAQILRAGRVRDRITFSANVAQLAAGNHTLAFRLSLLAA